MLADPAFRRTFLPTAKDGDEESAIKVFTKDNKANALKTKPKVRKLAAVAACRCRPEFR